MKLQSRLLFCVVAVAAVLVCLSTLPTEAKAASETDLTFQKSGDEYYIKDCSESASGELVIPATYNGLPVTIIGAYSFNNCTSLTIMTIGNSVTTIGEYAFSYCTSLTNVTIGDSVTNIGDSAFINCTSLTSVTVGDSVTSIEAVAFASCTSLTNLTYEGTVAQWRAITKGTNWNYRTGTYTIHCTDGEFML